MDNDYEFECQDCREWHGSYDALVDGTACPLCNSTDIDVATHPESVKLNQGHCSE